MRPDAVLAADILVLVLDLPAGGDEDRLYEARMEDAGHLTFQARTEPKLVEESLRRGMLPIVTGVGAAVLAIAALLYRAGDPGGWAQSLLVGGVFATLFALFVVPQQVVTRHATRSEGRSPTVSTPWACTTNSPTGVPSSKPCARPCSAT